MSKKTICALVAGFITALGVTGSFTVSDKNASDTRAYSALDPQDTGGWYSNKAKRGQAVRERIYKYMS